MKYFSLIFALYASALPNFSHGHARKTSERVETELVNPKIISFENELNAFWAQAKGQPFEKQVELCRLHVETPHQE